MKSICVFCGSNLGGDRAFREAATLVGKALARHKIQLVYGGASVGLMGTLANACLNEGGTVVGVMPRHLVDMEVAHDHLTSLRIVADMHERKQLMNQLSDAFLTLPGGIGTIEETFEMFTWLQLGLHEKPVGMLDTRGYYQHLARFLAHMVSEGFLQQHHLDMLIVDRDVDIILGRMAEFNPSRMEKWFDMEKNRVPFRMPL